MAQAGNPPTHNFLLSASLELIPQVTTATVPSFIINPLLRCVSALSKYELRSPTPHF